MPGVNPQVHRTGIARERRLEGKRLAPNKRHQTLCEADSSMRLRIPKTAHSLLRRNTFTQQRRSTTLSLPPLQERVYSLLPNWSDFHWCCQFVFMAASRQQDLEFSAVQ